MGDRERSPLGTFGGILVLVLIGPGAIGAEGPGPPLPRLVHLAPGSRVESGPPAGWSHRVIRSVPRLASGEIEHLPDSARPLATLLRTIITADVARQDAGYRLRRVGVGNAVPYRGMEVVVMPGDPEEVWRTLGTAERLVVRGAEAKLDEGRIVAKTPTFALFRTPTVLVVRGKHQDVDLYYSLLVEKTSGALTTLVWAAPTGREAVPAQVVLLDRDLEMATPLDARVTQWLGPLAVGWSFAMTALPPGRRLVVPAEVGTLLATAGRSTANAAAVERALRSLITPASVASPARARAEVAGSGPGRSG